MGSRPRGVRFGLVAVLVLPVLVACQAGASPPPVPTPSPTASPAPTRGSIYTVGKGTIAEAVEARGKTSAVRQAPLLFQIGGPLKTLNMAAGDQVSEDDLLAELETTELENALEDAQYELEIARLRLAQLQQYSEEESSIEKERILAERSYIDAQIINERDPIQLALLAIKKSLNDLDLRLLEARSRSEGIDIQVQELAVRHNETLVARAQAQLDKARLKAPFSGLILSLDAEPGDSIEPYQALAVLADPSELQVVASVPEAQVSLVALGQSASIVLDSYPAVTLTGMVKQIASKATVWQGRNVFSVTIGFDRTERVPWAIGMGADVTILTRIREGVLLIPTAAIYSDGLHSFVDVVEGGGVRMVEVQTGISSGGQTEVLSGLEEGQAIRIPD